MKLFKIFSAVLATLAGTVATRKLLDKYEVGIYYYDKYEASELAEPEMDSMDLRGTPTHECICGSKVFNLPVAFENYEIATYFLDMQCVECGSIYTAPTPLDRENME
jgi:hypothetical protein